MSPRRCVTVLRHSYFLNQTCIELNMCSGNNDYIDLCYSLPCTFVILLVVLNENVFVYFVLIYLFSICIICVNYYYILLYIIINNGNKQQKENFSGNDS